jgi:hypothetical protein
MLTGIKNQSWHQQVTPYHTKAHAPPGILLYRFYQAGYFLKGVGPGLQWCSRYLC